MELGIAGKRAIVTGASKGIGRAIARELAGEGVAVAICSRHDDELQRAAEELRSLGGRVFARPAHVTDPDLKNPWGISFSPTE